MSNNALESECFGHGWDGLTEQSCKDCNAQFECKDKFVNGDFWEFMSKPESKGKTWEELSAHFTVSIPSIQEAHNTMAAIIKSSKKEGEEVVEETKVVEEVVEETKVVEESTVVTTPVSEAKVEGPVKARRGRKPADLITCPVCGGTGGTADNICAVCGGYGDISAKKYAEMQKNEMKTNKKAEKEAAKTAKKAEKADKKKAFVEDGSNFVEGIVSEEKSKKVGTDISKSNVVTVKSETTGKTVVTWAKLPITVDDLVELEKQGCGVTLNVQDGKVQVSVFMEVPINTFFNRG